MTLFRLIQRPFSGILARALFCTLVFSIGCSTPSKKMKGDANPEELWKRACYFAPAARSVRGEIWLKTKSPDLTGQFSAQVLAEAPDSLKMEFTNILGGTEAIVTVRDGNALIQSPDQKKVRKERGTWGGIPLKWAADLFLGRIPCPDNKSKKLKMKTSEEGVLTVEVPDEATKEIGQVFIYSFKLIKSGEREVPWPESLHWESRAADPIQVEFKFDDPEEGSLSPKKWEAKSNLGALKIRWKERVASEND